ncbi:IS110 family transposase [Rhodococcus wratislaviensis]|uniref:Transposase IS110-like N-terminal domain-containing protein n=1 Tax=Rhodococcus wratislaviensis NBRC 100605 TaxID=1219028 RepID=X0Q758_RHOWR|nr:IS110 family transposase [Rhodococcus wratislaviensis]GAF46551.1 hypothetical protein RW1_031_01360 [Rhodococcus wratislaviensis NBRC 100605]
MRLLSAGHGRKSDDADAVSVGVAVLTGHGLTTARMDATVTALRAIVEHRDDLVKTRTQTINRLHVVLTHLIPAGAPRSLSADWAAEMLRRVRPREVAGKTLRGLLSISSPSCGNWIAGSLRPPATSSRRSSTRAAH